MFKIQSSFKISENVGGDHPTPTKLNWKVVEVHCPANMLLLKFLFIYFKIGEGDETIRVWIFIVWEFFFWEIIREREILIIIIWLIRFEFKLRLKKMNTLILNQHIEIRLQRFKLSHFTPTYNKSGNLIWSGKQVKILALPYKTQLCFPCLQLTCQICSCYAWASNIEEKATKNRIHSKIKSFPLI